MTEFKKVTDSVSQLHEKLSELFLQPQTALSGYLLLSWCNGEIASLTPRVRKLLLKARETDPNRQVYNEAMVGKIEELSSRYCSILAEMFAVDIQVDALCGEEPFDCSVVFMESDRVAPFVDAYEEFLLQQASQAALEQATASGTAAITEEEGKLRFLSTCAERRERLALEDMRSTNRRVIRELLEQREAERWSLERQRRQTESDQFEQIAAQWNEEALIADLLAVDPTRWLIQRLHEHGVTLFHHPERKEVRLIRTGNPLAIAHFGHACVQHAASPPCCCMAVSRATEVALSGIGYRPKYIAPAPNSELACRFGRNAVPPFLMLPCGDDSSKHEYIPAGYEPYGERHLALHEPDATNEPDVWFGWYQRLESYLAALERHMPAPN